MELSARSLRAPVLAFKPAARSVVSPTRVVLARATPKPGAVDADVAAVKPGATKAQGGKPAKVPKEQRPFTNKQVFVVPEGKRDVFEEAWIEREAIMRAAPGFEGFTMDPVGEEMIITSSWENIPAWEAMNLSKPYRRSHLPYGIYQRIPKAGEGFPEDFVPFLDMDTFVTARY